MANLLLYINNKYYSVVPTDEWNVGYVMRQLNDTIPKLNSIFPKHIATYDRYRHFILDINNMVHMVKYKVDRFYDNPVVKLYENVHQESTICEHSGIIRTVDNTKHGVYKLVTKHIRDIQHLLNDFEEYPIHDLQSEELFSKITVTTDGNLVINDNIVLTGVPTYIATIEVNGYIFVLYTNKITCINPWYDYIFDLPLDDDIIDGNIITQGITKQFVWTKDIHHYLSNDTRDIIGAVIMCNRFTKYERVPRFVLYGIINLFII